MEPRFGHDFSGVRVHADAEADERTRAVQARAYTIGREITFAAGEYAPASKQGQTLLAHELTHVVQQGHGASVLQRTPGGSDAGDVNLARTRAGRLAQRIRIHTRLSREVRASINSDLAFYRGAAKDAYIQIIRPALRAVTELQMPEQSMRRELPPVRPVSTLSLINVDELCGGKCFDEETSPAFADMRQAEQQAKAEQEGKREQTRGRLREMVETWSAEDQGFALDLLEPLIQVRTNIDPRAVSDRIRGPILERHRQWLHWVDGQRMAACAKHPPGWVATVRGRANNDDPCKSWFADEYSHGPSELLDLERRLRINRGGTVSLSPAEVIYWDLFEYRKKTDPGMLEQEQMAGAMVGVFVAVAGGINETVNRPVPGRPVPGRPAPPATRPPSEPEPFRVVQGGGQTTPARQGHLADTDKGPPPVPGIRWNRPGVNDNLDQPPLRATGTDPASPGSGPPSQANAPKAVRRIVNPDSPGTTIAPLERGTSTPATLTPRQDEPTPSRGPNSHVEGPGEGDRDPRRGTGSQQQSKNYAHDVGVSRGTKAAQKDGLVPYFENPFGIDPTTPGQDSVFINPKTGHPVVVEMKGGTAELAPGQMGNAEINRQVRELERRLPNHPVTTLVRDALNAGTLEGRTYSTRIDANGAALPTTAEVHGPYHRLP